ncbi:f-box family protein [Corchorus olitorius]|uniref:F-box family protein n=1 Tax=Corchorus olitorius TaxID=93759 RepID=A0A1R3GS14_9ROSI|nr:f-box family protein [Corchorus olitorius]
MEGKDDIVETNSCKRQRVSEEQVIDRISSLQDSVIVRILSFLPTEDAITIMVLNLMKGAKYWGYVDREMRITDKVDSWVDFAMRKEVKHLHLDFKGCGDSEPNAYFLPHAVFEQSIFEGPEVGCFLSTLTFKNPSIKSLIVELEHNSQRLQISCPNLVSLRLVGIIQLVDLVDVSSLAVSSIFFISFDSKCALSRHLDIRRVFQKLSHSTDDHAMYLVYTGKSFLHPLLVPHHV